MPTISLFTGCGGMDIGTERAGFVTLCQHEFSQCSCDTLIGNRPNFFRSAALIQGDIRQTSTWMILREAGLRIGECHLVTGGPPCQGFSTSNTKANHGTYDPRNDLVFEFLRVVRESQTRFFCMENVPGFLRFNKGEYLAAFLQAAHQSGYELVYGLANAVEYLVPQDRCRFLCMGTRRDLVEIDGLLGSLPSPVCFGSADRKRLELLEGVSGREAEAERARIRRPPGIRYFPDRPVLAPPDPWGNDGRTQTFNAFYDRLEREEPDRIIRHPVGGEEEAA
jgi:DNA-cytosine methyltransferase